MEVEVEVGVGVGVRESFRRRVKGSVIEWGICPYCKQGHSSRACPLYFSTGLASITCELKLNRMNDIDLNVSIHERSVC